MANTVTLSSLRTQILQRANREGDDATSGFVTTSELNQYINNSIGAFNDLLYDAMPSSVRKNTTLSVTSAASVYALPSDFKHLLFVEYQLNAQPGQWLDVRRCNPNERNKYTLRPLIQVPGVVPFEYDIYNDGTSWSLEFIPFPLVSSSVRVWYAPTFTKLSGDSDTLDGINGLEEFVIVDAAITVLTKEESDTSALVAERAALIQRVQTQGKNRDSNEPIHVGWQGATVGWDGGTGWE